MDDGREWSTEGRNILLPDQLVAIRRVLESVGHVIVEHWFYYGGCAPDRFVFDDFDALMEYLQTKARPGDAFYVWSFGDVCGNENTLAIGKYPDGQGRVPKGGAY